MKEGGFTLVELLVSLAIMVILLTIAIPGYAFLINANRAAAVTNELISAIHFARSEAIKRGMRVTICKTNDADAVSPACSNDANWEQGWLVFADGGIRGVVDSGDTLLRAQGRASPGTAITSTNYEKFISYLPGGVSQGSNGLANGTLQVCVAGNRRDIIINATGRPRLDSGIC
jgi:type IV fimbrial biogenesis protein FimT